MKIVLGILLVALLLGALILYLVLMLNAHDMVYCGDIKNGEGETARVTRVYTTDLNANETLSEIVRTMNDSESGTVSSTELTDILSQYQNIIYAPVFTISVTQADSSTYIIDGQVLNGLDENGDPASPDYRHSKMQLNTVVTNGRIIAAQNVYDDGTAEAQDIQDVVFTERQRVIDPIVTGADSEAAFAFQDCDSFRVIVNSSDFTQMPSITFVYVYNVNAVNPLDFTQISNDSLAVKMDLSHDNNGKLAASYELMKTVTADAQQ